MENTSTERIISINAAQKEYFLSGATLDVSFRKTMLRKFLKAMQKWETRVCDALWTDLHKSYEEAYLTEISIVTGEIENHIKHIGKWSRRERKHSPLKLFPSRSYIVKEPLGSTLIISPWNYPVQLLLNPLIGAISAGCTAVLKPSPYVPTVSKTIEEMIRETFEERYIAVVQGNRNVNTALLEHRWDLIFFTGSPALAKTVMSAAAENLTPVILELGGKSPCIIDKNADIALAAMRIAWGKTLNSGQTCIAPDYLLIHKDVKAEFVVAFRHAIAELHGEDVHKSEHYVRMVSDRAFERVVSYLDCGDVVAGGLTSAEDRYIEPTLLDNVSADSAVMREEIFGPVLPMMEIGDVEEAINFILDREKPLAMYVFAEEGVARRVFDHTSSGGGCINDTIMHIANEHLPFGGVGNSGMGRYHGRDSLYAFSHRRSVVTTPTWIDLPFRYMPYKLFRLVKKML